MEDKLQKRLDEIQELERKLEKASGLDRERLKRLIAMKEAELQMAEYEYVKSAA